MAARFCSGCAHPVNADTEARPTAREKPAARSLDYVPWWIGWLVIPVSLLIPGIILYPVWAYRRGRRDGVGCAATGQPYSNMGRKTVGWAAATMFGVIAFAFGVWYPSLRLATLWYKHGLRVGAREGTAGKAFSSLPSLAAAVGGPPAIALAVILLFVGLGSLGGLDGEAQTPARAAPHPETSAVQPTQNRPLLTGAEAAGIAEAHHRDVNAEAIQELLESGVWVSVTCDPEDYNDVTSKWIVFCTFTTRRGSSEAIMSTSRQRVDDRTGTVSAVQ